MKKVLFLTVFTLFFTHCAEQEERPMPQEQRQPERVAEQRPKQEERSPQLTEQNEQAMQTRSLQVTQAQSLQQLEGFFEMFPNPKEPEFALLPNLNKIVTQVYEETLGAPPVVFACIQRLYALIQSQALMQDNIELARLSEQQRIEINEQIIARCMQSTLWQNYNKMFITQSLLYGMSLLKSVHQEEKIIFTYIPNFETAYYSKGYTEIRNGSDLVRLSLVLSDGMRDRAISQCEWEQIRTTDQLYEQIEQYQESEFYQLTDNIQTLLKSPKKYPFPANDPFLDHNGFVSPAFNHFVYKEEDGRLRVAEYAQFLMNIDQNNRPYLTALGNFIFTYHNGESGPYLAKNPVFNTLFKETEQGLMPTPVFLEMLAIDGIKLLNAHLGYLFNKTNLEATMQKLTALEQKDRGFLQRFPNILPYMPEDYPYLAGIQELTPMVAGGTQPTASVQSWDSFWHSVGHAFTEAGDAIAHTAESAWHSIEHATVDFGKDLYHGIENLGKGVGYFFAAAACAIADPKDGAKFFQRSFSSFSNMAHDVGDAIAQVGTVIKATTSVVTSVVGQTIGAVMQDQKLGDDIDGLVDSLVDGVVDAAVDLTDYITQGMMDIYKLTAEAVEVLEAGLMAGITFGQVKGYNKQFLEDGNYFAKDFVSSILNELTFLTDAIGAILKAIMKGIAYLCSAIIDLIGDVAGDVAALSLDICDRNGLSVFNKIKNGVSTYRRSIIGGLLFLGGIAITVGTGGLGSPLGITMAVVGTGMMAIGTMGDIQQDIQALKDKSNEDSLLAKYKSSMPGSAITAKAMESAAMAEATVQFAAEKENSERGLVYYQNFLNNTFNSKISTQSSILGNYYQKLTTPNPTTGIPISDPGQLYGIKTGRMAFNPGGGFYLFNAGRNTFGQEIAVVPTQTHQTTQNNLFTLNQGSSGLWLNQKDLSNIWGNQMFEVEIRWRTIYETEGNFYVGLFASEQVMNIPLLQALNKNYNDAMELTGNNASAYIEKTWQNLDTFNRNLLNYNDLSRNFVIFKENGATPTLGFYQHNGEGDGWLNRDIGGVTYQRGVWYRMKMNIAGQQTRVKCWEEAAGEPNEWTTFNTPQAKRLPAIEPIPLPNDRDPFELIVTKPAPKPKTPQPEQRPESTQGKQPNTQNSTSTWHITDRPDTPETQAWNIKEEDANRPQTQAWNIKEEPNIQSQVVAWTISGKEQQSESQKIASAIGSMGVISSGVAIEYQIVNPATTLQVSAARKKADTQAAQALQQAAGQVNEQQRELDWLRQHGTAVPPTQAERTQERPDILPDQVTPGATNINAGISSSGKFSALGGPN